MQKADALPPPASRWRAAQPWLGSLALHAVLVFSLGLGAHLVTQPMMPPLQAEPLLISLQAPAAPLAAPTAAPIPTPKPLSKAQVLPSAAALTPSHTSKPSAETPLAAPTPQPSTVPTVVAAAAPNATVITAIAPAASAVPASQPAAAPAPTPLPSPPLAPLIHADFKTTYLQNPKPDYPAMSRRLGEAGTVTLWVAVNAVGTVDDLGVLRSSGFARLDEQALKAVKLWRFTPAKRGGQAVADKVSVPIEFGL